MAKEINKSNVEIMEFDFQDNNRTLKVFIGHENNKGVSQADIDEFYRHKGTINRFEVITNVNGREYVKYDFNNLDITLDLENNAINFYIN